MHEEKCLRTTGMRRFGDGEPRTRGLRPAGRSVLFRPTAAASPSTNCAGIRLPGDGGFWAVGQNVVSQGEPDFCTPGQSVAAFTTEGEFGQTPISGATILAAERFPAGPGWVSGRPCWVGQLEALSRLGPPLWGSRPVLGGWRLGVNAGPSPAARGGVIDAISALTTARSYSAGRCGLFALFHLTKLASRCPLAGRRPARWCLPVAAELAPSGGIDVAVHCKPWANWRLTSPATAPQRVPN